MKLNPVTVKQMAYRLIRSEINSIRPRELWAWAWALHYCCSVDRCRIDCTLRIRYLHNMVNRLLINDQFKLHLIASTRTNIERFLFLWGFGSIPFSIRPTSILYSRGSTIVNNFAKYTRKIYSQNYNVIRCPFELDGFSKGTYRARIARVTILSIPITHIGCNPIRLSIDRDELTLRESCAFRPGGWTT